MKWDDNEEGKEIQLKRNELTLSMNEGCFSFDQSCVIGCSVL